MDHLPGTFQTPASRHSSTIKAIDKCTAGSQVQYLRSPLPPPPPLPLPPNKDENPLSSNPQTVIIQNENSELQSPSTASNPFIYIHTPKLNKILRPLRSKLACFQQTASTVPAAYRKLINPFTPRRALPGPKKDSYGHRHTTYQLRKSSHQSLLNTCTNDLVSKLLNYNHCPNISDSIPSPLKPAIVSIHNAYHELVKRTWPRPAIPCNQPLSLLHLSAFAIGDLLAMDYEDETYLEDLNQVYHSSIPVSARGAVFLQHATRLIINSAHEMHVMYRVIEIAQAHASPFQFIEIAKSIVSNPMQLSIDFLSKNYSLARTINYSNTFISLLSHSICTSEHIERTTFLQFARLLQNQGDWVSSNMMAMRIIQIAVAHKSNSALIGPNLVACVRILIETTAQLDLVSQMNEYTMDAAVDLAQTIANTDVFCYTGFGSLIVPVCVVLLVIHHHTGAGTVIPQLKTLPKSVPFSMDLIYQYSPPTFWLEVALALHELGDHQHALLVVQDLLNDVYDGGEYRCGLSAKELIQWMGMIDEHRQADGLNSSTSSTITSLGSSHNLSLLPMNNRSLKPVVIIPARSSTSTPASPKSSQSTPCKPMKPKSHCKEFKSLKVCSALIDQDIVGPTPFSKEPDSIAMDMSDDELVPRPYTFESRIQAANVQNPTLPTSHISPQIQILKVPLPVTEEVDELIGRWM